MSTTRTAALALAFALLLTAGCGQSGAPATPRSADSGKKASDPAKVVATFLDAIRKGDPQTARELLTPTAIQKIREGNSSFAPPACETASYTPGETELVDDENALVKLTWTEPGADGQLVSEETTWVLNLYEGGWRIRGMASNAGPGEEPVLIDFEDPDRLQGPAQEAPQPNPQNTVGAPPSDEVRQAARPNGGPIQ